MSGEKDRQKQSADGSRAHDGCVADRAFGDRVRGYIDAEIGEEPVFEWGLACLDRNDLFHLRTAVHRYFRHVAHESIGDARDMGSHVRTVQRVGELVAALEAVEEGSGDANKRQNSWRTSERDRKYREEQAEMRRKAAERVKPDGY